MTATWVPVPANAPGAELFSQQADLIWIGLQLVTVAVALAFLPTGAGARLRSALQRLTGGDPYWTLTLFAGACLVVWRTVSLPLEYYAQVGHWNAWGFPALTGFPKTSFGTWLVGYMLQLAVTLAAVMLLLWIPFVLIARAPRLWWLWLTAIAVPVLTIVLVTVQVVITPMTTRLEPLVDPGLNAQIHAMAERCGAGRIPVFIGGNDETVVGLGPTSRILISRDALTAQTRAELLTTLAHELKHYRMGDNWLAIGTVGGLILAGALLVQVLGAAVTRRWGGRFGFASLADPAALPLMVLILTLAWALAGRPIFNAVQRHVEVEADRFALEVTHDNHAFATRQAAAAKAPWRMNDYDPFFEVFMATHPSQADRDRMGDSYRPWERGQPGVYDKVCRPASAAPRVGGPA
jgi:STE24 endopeptidase